MQKLEVVRELGGSKRELRTFDKNHDTVHLVAKRDFFDSA